MDSPSGVLIVLVGQVSGGDATVAETIAQLDVAALAILLIVLIIRGTFVTGSRYADMKEDRDWWRSTALRALNVGEAAVSRRNDP